MTRLRALLVAACFCALALAACGSGGAGGGLTSAAPATAAPALGTNEPANPMKEYPTSKPSGDPYSDSGY
jgi:hypothetical protein